LITSDGAVHLLDFGIATLITEGEATETPLTQFDGHVLTPEYASPEQISKIPVTTSSDVYALGVVLYELLTGTSPYPYSREQRAQLEQAIANAEVVSPSRAPISKTAASHRNTQVPTLRRTLRGELDTLLLKALKKDIDDRYASVDAFYEDIKRYLAYQPILAQPDSEWYRIKKFARRNRAAVASVAAIMVALLAGTGIALWQAHQASLQRDRAVASAARSEAVTKFMHLMITETADADEPVTVQTLLARTQEITSKLFADDTDQQVAVLEMLGDYYFGFNRLELAQQSFSDALALATRNPDPEIKARLHCETGGTYARIGDIPAAKQHVDAGLAMSGDFLQAKIICLQARGRVKWRTGDIDGMLNDDELALNILRTSGLVRPELNAALLAETANAELELGHATEAEHDYSTALEQLTKAGLGNRLTAMTIHSNWAAVGNYVGNPRDALTHLDIASAIQRKHIGANQAQTLSSTNHALVLRNLAHYDDALREYRLGLELAVSDRDTLSIVSAELGMSITLLELGHTAEAEQLLKHASLMVEKELSGDAFAAQDVLHVSGVFALKQRRYDDAISLFSQKIQFLSKHNGMAMLAHPLILRGRAHLAKGNLSAALSDATQAYDTSRSVQGNLPYSSYSGNAALLLARVEARRNQPDAARMWATIACQQLQGSLGDTHPTTIEAKQLLEQLR
jgi:serine/threonine-protein kinase